MHQNESELKRIGATIRALREKSGWRLGNFATAIQMSHGHLSNIESGRRPATVDALRKIADVLEVPLAAITTEYSVEEIAG